MISFPPLVEEDGTEGPMVIEAEVGGHIVPPHVTWTGAAYFKILCKIAFSVQRNNRKAMCKENQSNPVHSPRNVEVPSDRRNGHAAEQQDHTARVRNDLSGLERSRPWLTRQKKRGQAPKRNKAVCEKVEKLVNADFKDLNKSMSPKMAISLRNKTGGGSLCGGRIFCYSKMPFGLKNVGATYQRLVDKAFQKQIGRNLEAYVDDLVIKSCTEQEVIRGDGKRNTSDGLEKIKQ
ncbi:hypothetical protein Tco_0633783 [Tanacetum coccineum]